MLYQDAMHFKNQCAATSCQTIGLQAPPTASGRERRAQRCSIPNFLKPIKRQEGVEKSTPFVFIVWPVGSHTEGNTIKKVLRSNFLPNDRLARPPTASERERRAQRCQFSAPTKQTKAGSNDCFFRLLPYPNHTNKTATLEEWLFYIQIPFITITPPDVPHRRSQPAPYRLRGDPYRHRHGPHREQSKAPSHPASWPHGADRPCESGHSGRCHHE